MLNLKILKFLINIMYYRNNGAKMINKLLKIFVLTFKINHNNKNFYKSYKIYKNFEEINV